MSTCLLWFRRDLRIADNPALQALVDNGHSPIPVYIHDEPDPHWPLGAASAWWLHHSLSSLRESLRQCGNDLLIVNGDSLKVLLQLIEHTGATGVYWNRCYEPAFTQRDQKVKLALRQQGIDARSHHGSLLREPWQQLKKDDTPYRVFTPFWKALTSRGPSRSVVASTAAPAAASLNGFIMQQDLAALQLLPTIPWDSRFHDHWKPGEENAWNVLQNFCDNHLLRYSSARDLPGEAATSHLSPHLHFGEISPIQIWEFVYQWASGSASPGAYTAAESWLRQLAWREFSAHLLYHFAHTPLQPLDARFKGFPWREDYAEDLAEWKRGQTGIPLVDAGMRQLWATGYMHNRVRMIVASFLTKNLRIPWQEGSRWFWDTLVDADLANNTAGWQWTAGCGADAAPYFRVFNPVLQGNKFDRQGSYIRQWIPELARLPDKYIHQPWSADPSLLTQAEIRLGQDYPEPITDISASRKAALAAWDLAKQQHD